VSLFLNSNAQLRSGWKFGIYVVFFLLIWFATGIALTFLVVPRNLTLIHDELGILELNAIALFVPAVAAMLLTVRFTDHRPLRTFGIGFLPNWRSNVLYGLSVSAGMLGLVIAGCYAFGYVSMHWTGNKVPAGTLFATFNVLVLSALNEELVFRGFPLQVLIEGVGEWPAIVGFSALFGAIHLNNPNATYLGTLNTVVAGILLSLAYIRTRSLWTSYALHVGWNLGLGFIFGFPLSGLDIASLWTTGIAGNETILGGGYGPEGGLLATFIFGAAAVIVNRHGSNNPIQASPGDSAGRDHRGRTGDSR
jgi:membrane protease YdiL (CAAX protease family)